MKLGTNMNYMLICFGLFSIAATEPLTISRSDIELDSQSAPSSIRETVSNDKEKRGATKAQSDNNVPYTFTQPQYISAQPELIQPPPEAYNGPTIQAQHIQYIPPSQQQTFVTPVPHSHPQTKYQYVKPTVSTIPQQQLYFAPPSQTQYVFLQQPTHHHQPSTLAPAASASSLSQYYVPSSHSLGLPVGYGMQPIIMMLIPANHLTSSASNLHYYVAPRSLSYPAIQSYLLPPQHMTAATHPVTYVLQPTLNQPSNVPAQQITTSNNVKSQSQYSQVKG